MTPWTLANLQGRLDWQQLAAEVDVARPAAGLGNLQLDGDTLRGRILQAHVAPGAEGEVEAPSDHYVRGADLVVTYPQLPARPFRPQVYWRALSVAGHSALAALETIGSVQTSLLDGHPAWFFQSELPADEVLLLGSDGTEERLNLGAEPRTVDAEQRAAGFLFRLPGGAASYAELLHPADLCHSHLHVTEQQACRVRHDLFLRPLEKGVILRARLWGIFLPRADDLQAAASWYDALLRSDPPLTS